MTEEDKKSNKDRKKIPVCLRQPDAIYLQYGETKFRIDMGRFESYIVSVYEEDYQALEPYLAIPEFTIPKK